MTTSDQDSFALAGPSKTVTPAEFIVDLDDPFLSIKQVAEIFAVRPYAVREWINKDKIKGVKIAHQWRIQKSVVQKFAQDAYGDTDPDADDTKEDTK